jgi:hypothetical protein
VTSIVRIDYKGAVWAAIAGAYIVPVPPLIRIGEAYMACDTIPQAWQIKQKAFAYFSEPLNQWFVEIQNTRTGAAIHKEGPFKDELEAKLYANRFNGRVYE